MQLTMLHFPYLSTLVVSKRDSQFSNARDTIYDRQPNLFRRRVDSRRNLRRISSRSRSQCDR